MTTFPKNITAVDLFAGAGGFSEGLEQAGVQVLVAQELHPQPALTHVFNHPGTVALVGDIRTMPPSIFREMLKSHHGTETVDLVVGGPPCQGFSTAGMKKEGDPRNVLFDNYCDVIQELRPRVFIMENVPGFKKMYGGKMYNAAKDRFQKMGYRTTDRILNAVEFGVPQRRKRFVLVGLREDVEGEFEWPAPITANPDNPGPDLFVSQLRNHLTVEEALSDLAFLAPGLEATAYKGASQCDYQKERRQNSRGLFNHLATKHREKAELLFREIKEGMTVSSAPQEMRSGKKTMARLNRRSVSNTVLALPDDLIHYKHHRIPTVREMARLQSFDDDYVFIGKRTSGFIERKSDVPQYTQVGNAVPPLLGKALGRQVAQLLGGSVRDVRNLDERYARQAWIRGSSAYTGYTLCKEAEDHLHLYDAAGNRLALPIEESAPRAIDRKKLEDWTAYRTKGLRRQWVPDLQALEPVVELENRPAKDRAVEPALAEPVLQTPV